MDGSLSTTMIQSKQKICALFNGISYWEDVQRSKWIYSRESHDIIKVEIPLKYRLNSFLRVSSNSHSP